MRILALAPTIWSERWTNRQQLLSRIGRRETVMYSNAAWFTWDRRDPRWQHAPWLGRFASQDNVTVEDVPRWLVRSPKFPLLEGTVLRAQVARWRSWLSSHGTGPLVMQLFHPIYETYIDIVAPEAMVYQPYDLLENMPGWTAWHQQLEDRVLRRADLVVASSTTTAKRLSARSGRTVQVIPNGADTQLFGAARERGLLPPEDLARIPTPRIGYIGSIHPAVDLRLMAELARRHPQWHFVFIGELSAAINAVADEGFRQCHELPNVYFLGMKPRDAVPAYMLNMDVNTLCLRVGEGFWADAAYPLKLHEYLACGRSVVMSDLPEVRPFAHVLRIASGADDWERAIDEAIRGNGVGDAASRVAVAEQNSWDDRADQLHAALTQLVARFDVA